MLPSLREGDFLRWERIDIRNARRGDILGFSSADACRIVIHRLTRVIHGEGGRCFVVTAGDASGPDCPRMISGSVIRITHVLRNGIWRIPGNPRAMGTFIRNGCRIRKLLAGHMRNILKYLHLYGIDIG